MHRPWLFGEAVRRFEEGDDLESSLLFQQLIDAEDAELERARHYLRLIARRSGRLLLEKAKHLLAAGLTDRAIPLLRELSDGSSAFREEALALAAAVDRDARSGARAFEPFRAPVPRPPQPDQLPEPVIRRVPHMDVFPGPALEPGEELTVVVYADTKSARDDERVEEMAIETRARDVDVDVTLLATEHFGIVGTDVGQIAIRRDEGSSRPLIFRVRLRENAAAIRESVPGLTALFHYRGRPAGSVRRVFAFDAAVAPPVEPRARLAIDTVDGADLTVTIVAKPINDGRQFWCKVHSPLLPAYVFGKTGDWNLPAVSDSIVRTYLDEFASETDRAQTIARLKGAGRRFFSASPPVFQAAFWELIDAGHRPATIAIVSDEPYFPWELMVPNRRLGTATETRPPLGVECAIGRWTAGDSVAGCRALPLTPAYVIAPTYDGADALPLAQREAAWLVEELGAERIDPATFSNIEVKLREGGRHLIHFACHGSSEATEQTIYLNDNAKLDSTTFEGMDAADSAFAHARPLVFLNACEVGRGAPALVGVGGFAATFIRKGAGAVIAPLWSVKDDVASEVARVFYTSLGGSRPFAEILRDFRARAYDAAGGEDSYAAYCYYGDPQAARAAPSGVM